MSSESRPERETEERRASAPEADSAPDRTAAEPPRDNGRPGTEPASEGGPDPAPAAPTGYADRCYRSPAALAGGVLLLLLAGWLGVDALLNGTDRARLIALAGFVFAAPLVGAYTLRPAVYANTQRMRVRNPFRTITVPWGSVESVQSGYSSEFIADGTKYQLWSIPVSLRARKQAARRTERAERDASRGATGPARPTGLFGLGGAPGSGDEGGDKRAPSDQAIDELRRLAQDNGEKPDAQGKVTVRWAYEIMIPALAGGIALAVLFGVL